MGAYSSIEWTDATWNPVLGCTKVSEGCKNCYAESLMERFKDVKDHPFEGGFKLRLVPDKLNQPLKWKKPRKVFTCSMSDLFHEEVPLDYIKQIFQVMVKADRHVFQILTKRSKRLVELSGELPWPENIWMGVSIENSKRIYRAKDLAQIEAHIKFLSVEPLLERIEQLPLSNIDWVIVGGESGAQARPMKAEWARIIRDQCQVNGVPFFLKQLGGRRGKRGGDKALLDGRLWHELPESAYNYVA